MSSDPPLGLPYDPFADEVVSDPYPWYAWLRAHRPLHHVEHRDLWVLSRHADVRRAARDHRRLSSAKGVAYPPAELPMMLGMDPPEHDRLRRIVARRFTPRAVASWRPLLEDLVEPMVDELLDTPGVDVVEVLNGPLPVRAIAGVLGVPPEDEPRFKSWSDDVVEGFELQDFSTADPAVLARVATALAEMRGYVADLLADRRRTPGHDLLTSLLELHDGERLTDDEIFWFFQLLLVAGNETTTNLLGNLEVALIEDPAAWATLREDTSGPIPSGAVEEALRFCPPIQGFHRQTTTEVQIAGGCIPEDSRVLLLFASANRDGAVFDDPDRFDPRRAPGEHLAFGHGIHVCLGAHLARLEVTVVLEQLRRRCRGIRLAGDLVRTRNPVMRGVQSLPVELTAA